MRSRISYIHPPLKPFSSRTLPKWRYLLSSYCPPYDVGVTFTLAQRFYGENSSSPTQAASKGVVPMASHTLTQWLTGVCVCGISVCGTRFPSFNDFSLIQDREGPSGPWPRFRMLTSTMYDFDIVFLDRSTCISPTSPATIEHLEFNIRFRGGYDNDFCISYENLRDAHGWSHLDSITTHPRSRLQH